MLGTECVLLPESGPEFWRTLKVAALYADKVHLVLPPIDLPTEDRDLRMKAFDELPRDENPILLRNFRRCADYLRFLEQVSPETQLLIGEGLATRLDLSRIVEGLDGRCEVDPRTFNETLQTAAERFSNKHDPATSCLLAFDDVSAPCLIDLVPLGIFFLIARPEWKQRLGPTLDRMSVEDLLLAGFGMTSVAEGRVVLLAGYLAALSYSVQYSGATVVYPDALYGRALQASRDLFCLASSPIDSLSGAHAALANEVLRSRLPIIEGLEIEEILEFRQSRRAELTASNVAVHALSTDLDFSAPPQQVRRQAEVIAATRVYPAIETLRVTLEEARLNFVSKTAAHVRTLVSASIPIALSTFVSGATSIGLPEPAAQYLSRGAFGLSAVAVVAPLMNALRTALDLQLARQKARNLSPWRLLLALDERAES